MRLPSPIGRPRPRARALVFAFAIVLGLSASSPVTALGDPLADREQPSMGANTNSTSLFSRNRGDDDEKTRQSRDLATLPLPVVVDKGRVVVRAKAGMETIAARIARSAEKELEGIYEDLKGLPIPAKVEIRLVGKVSEIRLAAPHPNVPQWAVGVAFSKMGIVVAAQSRGGEVLDIDNTVAHELAHLALGAALDGRAPRWLNEGFAYLHSSDWSMERFRTLVGMAWSNDVIDLHKLDNSFPRGEHAAHRAYAQSYDFVAFLARRGRYADPRDDGNPWPFRRFLAAIANGQTPSEAAQTGFGTPLSSLFGEWRSGLRSRYLLVPAEMFALGIWIFGALLLIIGYLRRKRQNRATIARWDREDEERERAKGRALKLRIIEPEIGLSPAKSTGDSSVTVSVEHSPAAESESGNSSERS